MYFMWFVIIGKLYKYFTQNIWSCVNPMWIEQIYEQIIEQYILCINIALISKIYQILNWNKFFS